MRCIRNSIELINLKITIFIIQSTPFRYYVVLFKKYSADRNIKKAIIVIMMVDHMITTLTYNKIEVNLSKQF